MTDAPLTAFTIGARHVMRLLAQRESRVLVETDPALPGAARWLDQLDAFDRELIETYTGLVALYKADLQSATAPEDR
ncbi:MAG: hypothetical protein JZU52_12550 [Lamprocystis purpurea]|jgi:hypothetical protein|uniref:hypothetical protein n=1 Tax=Lamprocystis purpurea TaxID=61598 RepID=UPI0003616E60|nr:hypothetical protein [Lamprocystis purpurea]MBV5274425.1 hypothetical protein [Lamprocystis purpurea]